MRVVRSIDGIGIGEAVPAALAGTDETRAEADRLAVGRVLPCPGAEAAGGVGGRVDMVGEERRGWMEVC